MALSRGVRFTANDIWDMPEDGKRYEVVDGELYVTPPPLEAHQKASTNLVGYIWQYVHQRRLGTVYSAPFGVVLDEENGSSRTSCTCRVSARALWSNAG